ncbi:hypothetical protein [Nostoc sp. PCC 7107]|uniref:hypothetical protein n=1 Tax=Nostoc sp. PCC 7107 TaxID=317936 RepID=UPI00029ED34C|nr:hypothetical protein [Nostoc sp. PCC 7107]AFY41127.1 hypothetical protein Nos7107_0454 [Nostoc sp. PCC 7107]
MSKMGCTCGHSIIDRTDKIPYKGHLIKDQDKDVIFEGIASDVSLYIESLLTENQEEWLKRFPWLQGKDHRAVVWGIITQYYLKYIPHIYECENCGRLLIQENAKSQKFLCYLPSNPEIKGVLRSDQLS